MLLDINLTKDLLNFFPTNFDMLLQQNFLILHKNPKYIQNHLQMLFQMMLLDNFGLFLLLHWYQIYLEMMSMKLNQPNFHHTHYHSNQSKWFQNQDNSLDFLRLNKGLIHQVQWRVSEKVPTYNNYLNIRVFILDCLCYPHKSN